MYGGGGGGGGGGNYIDTPCRKSVQGIVFSKLHVCILTARKIVVLCLTLIVLLHFWSKIPECVIEIARDELVNEAFFGSG